MKKYIITFSDKRKKDKIIYAKNRPQAIAECLLHYRYGFVVKGARLIDVKKALKIDLAL